MEAWVAVAVIVGAIWWLDRRMDRRHGLFLMEMRHHLVTIADNQRQLDAEWTPQLEQILTGLRYNDPSDALRALLVETEGASKQLGEIIDHLKEQLGEIIDHLKEIKSQSGIDEHLDMLREIAINTRPPALVDDD